MNLQSATEGWDIPPYAVQFSDAEMDVIQDFADKNPSEDDIHQFVEYWRCQKDILYFVDTYLHINTVRGFQKWLPYKWQYRILTELAAGRNVIVLKSRQVGCSWVGAAFALWLALFHPGQKCYFYSINEEKASTQLGRVKDFISRLPDWMRAGIQELTFQVKFTDQRSFIKSLPAGPNAGRGDTANFIMCDEMAFWMHAERMWAGIQPAISSGGICFNVSTPPEPEAGRTMYQIVLERVNKGIDTKDPDYARWQSFKIHYSECRGRDEVWVRQQKVGLTTAQWDREYELSLSAVGHPFFSLDHLQRAYQPEKVTDVRHGLYFTGVDSSELLKGGDLSSIQSLDSQGIQADCWHSDPSYPISITEWAGMEKDNPTYEERGKVPNWILEHPGITYIERNNQGLVTWRIAQRYHSSKTQVYAWYTGQTNRHKALNELSLDIEQGSVVITDEYTYHCLQNFVQTEEGKPVAAFGWNDDPVLALALSNQARRFGMTQLMDVTPMVGGQARANLNPSERDSYQGPYAQRRVPTLGDGLPANVPRLGGESRCHLG